MKLGFDGDNPTAEINSAFLGALAEGSRVDVVFLGCGEVPTESQLAEVRRLDSGDVDLFEPLGKALIAEWNSSLRRNPQFFAAFDPLGSIDNLIECASVHTVYVHPEDAEGVCLGLGGEWELDEEHGFGVLVLNQRVLEVGYEDLASSFDNEDSECLDEASIRQRIDSIHEMLRNIEAHNDRQN